MILPLFYSIGFKCERKKNASVKPNIDSENYKSRTLQVFSPQIKGKQAQKLHYFFPFLMPQNLLTIIKKKKKSKSLQRTREANSSNMPTNTQVCTGRDVPRDVLLQLLDSSSHLTSLTQCAAWLLPAHHRHRGRMHVLQKYSRVVTKQAIFHRRLLEPPYYTLLSQFYTLLSQFSNDTEIVFFVCCYLN